MLECNEMHCSTVGLNVEFDLFIYIFVSLSDILNQFEHSDIQITTSLGSSHFVISRFLS